ncbi:MAG TPA: hypothetical protein VNS19_08300 [Acidimicrobiales bacterium]|nr:hypothetical protein [Acidimicrobiales bacterium]
MTGTAASRCRRLRTRFTIPEQAIAASAAPMPTSSVRSHPSGTTSA